MASGVPGQAVERFKELHEDTSRRFIPLYLLTDRRFDAPADAPALVTARYNPQPVTAIT